MRADFCAWMRAHLVNQRSAMRLSDHFGGCYACSLTAANSSIEFA